MPDPKVCAACGLPVPDTDTHDDLDVCSTCRSLHVELEAPPAEAPPVARRVVETPTAPSDPSNPWGTAAVGVPATLGGWAAVAAGYRYLRNALLALLVCVPATVAIRLLELLITDPRQPHGEQGLPDTSFAPLVFLVLMAAAVIQFLYGAVALTKKPRGGGGNALPLVVCVSAFIPGVNLIAFPLLLCLYTRAVGIEGGNRSVVRSAWVLLGCAFVLVPPMVFACKIVLDWVADRAVGAPVPSASTNSEPVAIELLFGAAAWGVLCLGASVVSTMTLGGVARAIERTLRAAPPSDDPDAHFARLKDTLRPGESRGAPT